MHARCSAPARRALAGLAVTAAISLSGGATAVQAQAATGRVEGTVTAALTSAPVPYAVASIAALGRERFSDASGRFVLAGVADGTHELLIRRLGFSPWRGTVRVEGGAVTRVAVTLTPIPTRLPTVAVRALARCPNPGPPDPVLQSETYALVSLLRENADRYRLLASQYAFDYVQSRAIGVLAEDGFHVQRVDSVATESGTKVLYRPGAVVSSKSVRGRPTEFTMAVPTLIDIADDQFINNHCFGYGGTTQERGETWFRINMRAADRLKSPDVHGAFYLDSATAQLRRMDLDLSRADRLPRELRGVSGVSATTAFVEIAAGLSVIESLCAVNRLKNGRTAQGSLDGAPAELQQLLYYRFSSSPIDVLALRAYPAAGWVAGRRLPRSMVPCAF